MWVTVLRPHSIAHSSAPTRRLRRSSGGMASRSNLSQEDPACQPEKGGYSDPPSVLHQEVDQAGDGGSEKYPRKLIPVKEREAEERRGFARVDSGKEETDGGKDEKPVP